MVERMANVCGGRCGSGCSTSLRPSPRAVATARAGRTAFRLQAKRDDGEEDPLRERIYLEEGNRGRVSKPELEHTVGGLRRILEFDVVALLYGISTDDMRT